MPHAAAPHERLPDEPRARPRQLALTAAAGLCVAVAGAVIARGGRTASSIVDRPLRGALNRRRSRPRPGDTLSRVLHVATAPGRKEVYLPAAALAAVAVARRRGALQALPLGAALLASSGAHRLARTVVHRRRPPWALVFGKRSPSFPSGHATRASAAAFAVGYALVREGVAPAGAVVPVAVALPAAAGASRAWADVHWGTDVLGGWGLGVAVGAGAALWYEWLRREPAR